jgi:hypothetical protein
MTITKDDLRSMPHSVHLGLLVGETIGENPKSVILKWPVLYRRMFSAGLKK